jgi:hypothetical protein
VLSRSGDVLDPRVKEMLQPSRTRTVVTLLSHCCFTIVKCVYGDRNGYGDGGGDVLDPRVKEMLQPSRALVLLLQCCHTVVSLLLNVFMVIVMVMVMVMVVVMFLILE